MVMILLAAFLVLTPFVTAQNGGSGVLADTARPMFQHDPEQTGRGSTTTATTFTHHYIVAPYNELPQSIVAVDVDKDGDKDLLTGSSRSGSADLAWWENDGDLNFTEIRIADDEDDFWHVAGADFDGDGDVDILTSRADQYVNVRLTVYENDGFQSFTPHDIYTVAQGVMGWLNLVDMDRDGDTDIVHSIISGADGWIMWQENLGGLAFASHTVEYQAGIHLASCKADDIDGDGDLDIVATYPNLREVYWWDNNGSQSFTKHLISDDFPSLGDLYAAETADLDNDGDVDVVVSGRGGLASVWAFENDGLQNFSKHTITSSLSGASELAVGDIDRDGNIDVLCGGWTPGTIEWYENNGAFAFTIHAISSPSSDMSRKLVDLNGDANLDILGAARYTGNHFSWWENDLEDIFTVDIKCNGQDSNVAVSQGHYVTLTIKLVAGDLQGIDHDVWVLARDSSLNLFSYGSDGMWHLGWSWEYFTGPLANMSAIVFDAPLPVGSYQAALGLDSAPNGNFNLPALVDFDAVNIEVLP